MTNGEYSRHPTQTVKPVIHVQELCKSNRRQPVLTDLTFRLNAGDRLALLGVNGAGKTLLLKILATLIKPTSGSIEIAGYDVIADVDSVRPLIGYIPEAFDGYPDLAVREYLEFFAAAYKLERAQRRQSIEDVLDLIDLSTLREQRIGHLSLGQKRRLALAKTFLHDPLIWLLDGALSALDPRGQIEMEALIRELGAMGKTVVLATNRVTEVPSVCNIVGILAAGRLAVYGEIGDLSQRLGQRHQLEIEVLSGIDAAKRLLEGRSDLTSLEVVDGHIRIESELTEREIASLLNDLIGAGVAVVRFQKTERWLEDLFMEVTQSGTGDGG